MKALLTTSVLASLFCIHSLNVSGIDKQRNHEPNIMDSDFTSRNTISNDSGETATNRAVEMLVFSVASNNTTVELNWETGFEINNDYFTIERSIDITNWSVVGSVSGSGNSSNPMSYHFTDNDPINGISYYRIKQTDYNGTVTYSKIEAIEIKNGSSNVMLFPQPCGPFVSIKLKEFNGGYVTISFLTPRGMLIRKMVINSSSSTLDISDLINGIYFIKVEGFRLETEMLKLIKD